MPVADPPHPGLVVRELCLDRLGLSVTEAAAGLGVSRNAIFGLLNGRSGISAEMALRLALAFDVSPESWLVQQAQYDLARARAKASSLAVRRFEPV